MDAFSAADLHVAPGGHGSLDPVRIRQVGSSDQCGKRNCRVRHVGWRVGIGRFDIQVYACSAHLSWAVALDLLTESSAKAMGWRVTTGTISPVWITPTMPTIQRTDFGRTPDVSEQFPQARPVRSGSTRYTHIWRTA